MGRVKLKIKKLESTGSRQVTFSKRKNGIMKKAKELAILCDIDIVLLMFSPTGKPTLYQGERSSIEEVITKFAELTPQERAKRKLESLEALKKTFKKLDHDVNIKDFVGSSSQDFEELINEVTVLRDQIGEAHKRLSYWRNPDSISNIQQLQQMEGLIRESLNQTRLHKENLRRHQLLSQEFTGQYPGGEMSLPLLMDEMQGIQPLLWLPNYGTQQITLPNEPNFLQPGDVECSFPSYPSYYNPGKQIEAGVSGQVDSMPQGDGGLNELSGTSCSTLQLGEQYQYPPTCDGSSFQDEKRLNLEMEMNLHGNYVDNQLNGKLDLSRSLYDDEQHPWGSIPGPCSIPMYQSSNAYHHHVGSLLTAPSKT
ncbi:agamous-like MADS-box protein AGL65 isoform X2 [Cucurbita maxima]|uniref:Agamous-like MADS-box protein AGL65 isoform X2 n=2 Tax=Cucurbita TaxID=3660 RepID=A0A6J1KKR3_CUCMA|nr:agamous-like MADS-box protein AGL65 isoform X2 [Cucurbita moschata]XP_023000709.1 agamous-like MADS-box protein AGL65 isoform X2 [Cucurbita maxima]